MFLVALLSAVFVATVGGTNLMRRFAVARHIVDVPGTRSSHAVATPRGGGVAFSMSYLAGQTALVITGHIESTTAIGIAGAGLIAVLVGFVDDCRSVPARWRLVSHAVAAAWVLYWIGVPSNLEWFGVRWFPGTFGTIIAVVALVWLLNLYNFMDGIDGLAAVEALTASLGAVVVSVVCYAPVRDFLLPAMLAAAVSGFLLWNLPPARIFMGDTGSGFLGITIGAIALHSSMDSPRWLWIWGILLGVFITDATVTLCHRLLRGERVLEAHRSHAYQHAAQAAGQHAPVTVAVAIINLFWLLPWALAVGRGFVDGSVALVFAYAPLLGLAYRWRAGASAPPLPNASSAP